MHTSRDPLANGSDARNRRAFPWCPGAGCGNGWPCMAAPPRVGGYTKRRAPAAIGGGAVREHASGTGAAAMSDRVA